MKLANGILALSHFSCKLSLCFGNKQCILKCRLVPNLSAKVTIGIEWLQQVNLAIDWLNKAVNWDTGKIKVNM